MASKRYKPDEVVGKLSQADSLHGQGIPKTEAIQQLGVHYGFPKKRESPQGFATLDRCETS